MFLLFIIGGISGNILISAMLNFDSLILGPNAGIYAIYGGGLAFLIYNWHNFGEDENIRGTWLC